MIILSFLVIISNGSSDVFVASKTSITVVSPFSSSSKAVAFKESDEFKLSFGKLKIYKDIFLKIVKIGVPAGMQGMVFSLSNVVIQSTVNSFGPVAVAGNSACQSIEGFIYISMNGLAQSCLTFVSQNMGARKIDRIKKVAAMGLGSVMFTGIFL